MATLVYVLVIVMLPATTISDFCSDNMPGSSASGAPSQDLFFYDDFRVDTERDRDGSISSNSIHFISETMKKIKSRVVSANSSGLYLTDGNTGRTSSIDFATGKCNDLPLYSQGRQEDVLHSVAFSHNSTRLADTERLFHWNHSGIFDIKDLKFINFEKRRGIPVAHWKSCDKNYFLGKNLVMDWYISNDNIVTMPPGKQKILIARQDTYEDKSVVNFDYSIFRQIPSSDLIEIMENTNFYQCDGGLGYRRNTWRPLPTMPKYFTFTSEQTVSKITDDIHKNRWEMKEFWEIYDFEYKIFFSGGLRSTGPGDTEEEAMVIQIIDYNDGYQFNLNQNRDICFFHGRLNEGRSAIALSGGFEQMRTPKQFFDFDNNNYQYYGKEMVRGLECDAWSTEMNDGRSDHVQSATYTWYFLSSDQMKKLNYAADASPTPVRLDVLSEEHTRYDFFHFQTKRRTFVPINLDRCHAPNRTVTVRMTFTGDYVNEVAPEGLPIFQKAFMETFLRFSGVVTPLRISDIETAPALGNPKEFVVSFRLFAAMPKGNVFNVSQNLTTQAVLKNLNDSVDKGTFTVDTGSKAYAANKGSLQIIGSSGTYISVANYLANKQQDSGNGGGGNSPVSGGGGNSPASGGGGYSPGSMAGLAIGMIIVGLALGAGGVYLFKRYRSTGIDTQFRMSKLNAGPQD